MNTAYSHYCKYLKSLLEVECAEKELDFNKIFSSCLIGKNSVDNKKKEEDERKRREDDERKKREEDERKKREEDERKKREEDERKKREDAARKKREEEERKKREAESPEPPKRGDLEFDDGYYVGETRDGLMHGRGTRYWDHDDKKWEGEWVEGEACGHVVVSFGDFVAYDGQMWHSLPNGPGVYTDMHSGQRYEGNFVDFMRDGEGILYTENGDKIYEGDWKNNKYHGYGMYFMRGQCRYDGWWENGKRNGDGIAYDQNGNEEYNGTWKDDVRLNDIDRIHVASEG